MSKVRFEFPVQDSDFRKSRYSNPGGIINKCVEVARTPQGVALRNSNDPTKTTIFHTQEEWEAFVKGVKDGEFD